MKLSVIRGGKGSYGVAVGTWNPLFVENQSFIRSLVNICHSKTLAPALVIMWPEPAVLMRAPGFVQYHSTSYALQRLLSYSDLAIYQCNMRTTDLEAPAEAFLTMLQGQVNVQYLLLRSDQSLGRGRLGDQRTVKEFGEANGFETNFFPSTPSNALRVTISRAIHKGNFDDCLKLVGEYPTWLVPPHGKIKMRGWPSGYYLAEATDLKGKTAELRVYVDARHIASAPTQTIQLRFLRSLAITYATA